MIIELVSSILVLAAKGMGADVAQVPEFVPCQGSQPAVGQTFSGFVLQVMDHDSLCIAKNPTPTAWVQVRLTDFPPATTRGALMAASFAQKIDCITVARDADRVVAKCSAASVPLGRLVRLPEIRAAGERWR